MLFYRLSGTITGAKEIEACKDRYDRMDWAGTINFMTSAFNQMHQENVFFFVSDILEKSVSIGIINRSISDIEQYIKPYLEAIELNLIQTVLDEIKIVRLKSMLRNASRDGFIDNDREVLELLELDGISGIPHLNSVKSWSRRRRTDLFTILRIRTGSTSKRSTF